MPFASPSARTLSPAGRWLKDAEGRFVLFRGVNFAGRSKRPPYLPVVPWSESTSGRFAQHLDAARPAFTQLSAFGMNVVRLPIFWAGLEPTPGVRPGELPDAGKEHLRCIRALVEALWAHGLPVIVDFHQDIASEAYGGSGFPSWAVVNDDRTRFPVPHPGFRRVDWGKRYYDSEGVRRTLGSFWRDFTPNQATARVHAGSLDVAKTQTRFLATFRAVADALKDLPGVLGFEPFNEPHGGEIDPRVFEADHLANFYRRAESALREVDSDALLFVEPRVDWTTYGFDGRFPDLFTLNPETALDTSNLGARTVFAFHHYDPWTAVKGALGVADDLDRKRTDWPLVYRKLCAAAEARRLSPFVTEFGVNFSWHGGAFGNGEAAQDLRYLKTSYDVLDRELLSAIAWHYDLFNTQADGDSWNVENHSLRHPNGSIRHPHVVGRPYPQHSAAEPTLLEFDVATGECAMRFEGPAVAAPTIVHVPVEQHYPNGFDVRCSVGGRVEWDAARRQLAWWMPTGAASKAMLLSKAGANVAARIRDRETGAELPLSAPARFP